MAGVPGYGKGSADEYGGYIDYSNYLRLRAEDSHPLRFKQELRSGAIRNITELVAKYQAEQDIAAKKHIEPKIQLFLRVAGLSLNKPVAEILNDPNEDLVKIVEDLSQELKQQEDKIIEEFNARLSRAREMVENRGLRAEGDSEFLSALRIMNLDAVKDFLRNEETDILAENSRGESIALLAKRLFPDFYPDSIGAGRPLPEDEVYRKIVKCILAHPIAGNVSRSGHVVDATELYKRIARYSDNSYANKEFIKQWFPIAEHIYEIVTTIDQRLQKEAKASIEANVGALERNIRDVKAKDFAWQKTHEVGGLQNVARPADNVAPASQQLQAPKIKKPKLEYPPEKPVPEQPEPRQIHIPEQEQGAAAGAGARTLARNNTPPVAELAEHHRTQSPTQAPKLHQDRPETREPKVPPAAVKPKPKVDRAAEGAGPKAAAQKIATDHKKTKFSPAVQLLMQTRKEAADKERAKARKKAEAKSKAHPKDDANKPKKGRR